MDGFWLLLLTSLVAIAHCVEAPHPLITPFAFPHRPRDLSETCGYDNADILSPLGCSAGSSCTAAASDGVAGGCCRLASTCDLPTRCVESASYSRGCNNFCRTHSLIVKCTESSAPYCYTRYWVSGAETPSELGCTTTQGLIAYVYTTYTGFGASITGPTSRSTTLSGGAAEAAATGSGGIDQATTTAATQQDQDGSDSSNGPPAGAIAGGVVGGLAVLGAVAILIAWMILRHRRNSRAAKTAPNTAPLMHSGDKESSQAFADATQGGTMSPQSPTAEQRAFEMESGQKRHEVHERTVVPELP